MYFRFKSESAEYILIWVLHNCLCHCPLYLSLFISFKTFCNHYICFDVFGGVLFLFLSFFLLLLFVCLFFSLVVLLFCFSWLASLDYFFSLNHNFYLSDMSLTRLPSLCHTYHAPCIWALKLQSTTVSCLVQSIASNLCVEDTLAYSELSNVSSTV